MKRLLVIGLMFMVGCLTQQPDSQTESVSVPGPQGEVVLTVSGNIGKVNAGSSFQFDMETLKSLLYTTIVIPDPHLEVTIEYGGVLLKDILDYLGAENFAEVTVVATDGYSAVIKAEDLGLGILIAYTADGEEIGTKSGGPLKIVFSEDAQEVYAPEAWVWWVTDLEVS
ncbi:MAG: molybdopterin-dependent oxidoreductase [Theionarchaea archaeon]|nr:molybdopterin-dependent oxidoreductase [Theionarchaea archaeon]MBU7038283.1 molybdopterin-dependent oxidoreductase [Theionarchaea archaeon]